MRVREILEAKGTEVVTSAPEVTVGVIAGVLSGGNIGSVIVVDTRPGDDKAHIAGLFSERDIVRAIAARGTAALEMPVADFMTREVVYCEPEDLVCDLMATMTAHRIRHLPVMDGGKLAGIVSIGDVVKLRLAETESEAAVLRDYISAR